MTMHQIPEDHVGVNLNILNSLFQESVVNKNFSLCCTNCNELVPKSDEI